MSRIPAEFALERLLSHKFAFYSGGRMDKPQRFSPLSEKEIAARKNLRPPWKAGENPGTRISNEAAKAIRLARKYCPDMIQYAYSVAQDTSESTTLRLKAADLILMHGMPRGDNSRYMNEETIGGITLTFVKAPQEPAPVIDAVPLTVYTPTQGSGD